MHAPPVFVHHPHRLPRSEGRPTLLTGVGFWRSPCVSSSVSGIRTTTLPLLLRGKKGAGEAYRGGFFGSPCIPFLILGFRTPRLPLLPVWEKGGGGMRGKSARKCRKPPISPKKSTLERSPLPQGGRGRDAHVPVMSHRCTWARRPRSRHAGETPAPPGGAGVRERIAVCGRDARAPGMRAGSPRPRHAS